MYYFMRLVLDSLTRTWPLGWAGSLRHWHHVLLSLCVVGGTALSTAILHAIEVSSWAAAYQFLGTLPNRRSAMLYSMNAMTSYGHVNLYLAPRWQMMGSLEALNGWILFPLTIAFLFAIVQKARSSHRGPNRAPERMLPLRSSNGEGP